MGPIGPIKWLFKWAFRLIFVVIALIVAALVYKDTMLRGVIEREIRSQTGMEAKIGKCSSGWFSPVVTLENLKLYNTAEFGGSPFLNASELHFEFDPGALAQQKVRVTLMRCAISEFNIVRNETGQTNVVSLLGKAGAGFTKSAGLRVRGKLFTFDSIEVLNLSLATARFVDLKNPRNNHESRVNMQNEIFRQVKGENDLDGILAMIWLRSGGTFSLKPDVAQDSSPPKPGPVARPPRPAAAR